MSEKESQSLKARFSGRNYHEAFRFSHQAMATLFEIFIIHESQTYARQAAGEAFRELDGLEHDLSRFIENSDISRINHLSGNRPVRIGLNTFECLRRCAELFRFTNGAFDPTVGALVDYWKRPSSVLPVPEKMRSGMDDLVLNGDTHEATFEKEGACLDLGGIGKGFALDCMGEILREWDIPCALLHGGKSTVLALEPPPGETGWPLAVTRPPKHGEVLFKFALNRRAVSGSGLEKGNHIMNPRTGTPVSGKMASWISANDATASDALSTAIMVMNPEEIGTFKQNRDIWGFVILDGPDGETRMKWGEWPGVSEMTDTG